MVETAQLNQDRFDPIQNRLLSDVELATRRSGFTEQFGRTAARPEGGGAREFRAVAENLAEFDRQLAAIRGRVVGEAGVRESGLKVKEEATRAAGFGGLFGDRPETTAIETGARTFRQASPENLARFQQELRARAPEVIFTDTAEEIAIRGLGFAGEISESGSLTARSETVTPELQGIFDKLLGQAQASLDAGGVAVTGDNPNQVQDSGLTLFAERNIAKETGFIVDPESGVAFDEQLQQFLNSSPGIRTEFNARVSRELARQSRLFGTVEKFRTAAGQISLVSAASSGLGFAKFAAGPKAGNLIDDIAAAAAPELFAAGTVTVAEAVKVSTQFALNQAKLGGLDAVATQKLVDKAAARATAAAGGSGAVSLSGLLAGAGFGFTVGSFFAPGGKVAGAQIGGAIGGAAAASGILGASAAAGFGFAQGAALGSIIPGPGTIIGAIVGAAIGSFFGPGAKVPQSNFFAPFNDDGTFVDGETRFAAKTQGTEFSVALAGATEEFTAGAGSLGIRFFGGSTNSTTGIFGGNLGQVAHITLNFPAEGINEKVDFNPNDSESISEGIVEAMLRAVNPDTTSPITNEAMANINSEGMNVPEYLSTLQDEVIRLAEAAGFVDSDGELIIAGGEGTVITDINGEIVQASPEKVIQTRAQVIASQVDSLIGDTKAGLAGIKSTIKTGPSGLLDIAPTRRRRLVGA